MFIRKQVIIMPLAALALVGGGAIAGYASLAGAQSSTSTDIAASASTQLKHGFHRGKGMAGMHGFGMKRGVMGKVTAVDGSTITVTAPNGTSYTVNASGATFKKFVTSSAADISVGDQIDAQGTVSGTTVTATNVLDGIPAFAPKAQ